jgi:hypothetical protein
MQDLCDCQQIWGINTWDFSTLNYLVHGKNVEDHKTIV